MFPAAKEGADAPRVISLPKEEDYIGSMLYNYGQEAVFLASTGFYLSAYPSGDLQANAVQVPDQTNGKETCVVYKAGDVGRKGPVKYGDSVVIKVRPPRTAQLFVSSRRPFRGACGWNSIHLVFLPTLLGAEESFQLSTPTLTNARARTHAHARRRYPPLNHVFAPTPFSPADRLQEVLDGAARRRAQRRPHQGQLLGDLHLVQPRELL